MPTVRNYINEFTGNRVLNAALLSLITAQILKGVIVLARTRRLDLRRIIGTGGMPSSHAATAVGLTTSVGKIVGIYSPSFAVSVVLTLIVMYDALNVRRAAGEQAKVINYMMHNWDERTPDLFTKQLKELLGHKPIEVLAGAVLGFLFGFFM